MGWLDGLFSGDPAEEQSAGSNGWLGPLAGGPVPFGQGHPGAPQAASLLDRLTAGANNLTSGGNPIAGIFNAVNGLATGQRTDHAGVEQARQQATMQALMNAGIDPMVARAAAINPDYLRAIVAARYGAGSATQPVATVARTQGSGRAHVVRRADESPL